VKSSSTSRDRKTILLLTAFLRHSNPVIAAFNGSKIELNRRKFTYVTKKRIRPCLYAPVSVTIWTLG